MLTPVYLIDADTFYMAHLGRERVRFVLLHDISYTISHTHLPASTVYALVRNSRPDQVESFNRIDSGR